MLTVPQHPRLWGLADEFAQHKRRYVRRRLAAQLHAAGVPQRATLFVVSLLPILVLCSLEQCRMRATYEHLPRSADHPRRTRCCCGCSRVSSGPSAPAPRGRWGSSLLVVVAVAR